MMKNLVNAALCSVLFLIAALAFAQAASPTVFIPSMPTAGSGIAVTVRRVFSGGPILLNSSSVSRPGQTVVLDLDITYGGFAVPSVLDTVVSLGSLPSGAYVLEVYETSHFVGLLQPRHLVETVAFNVAPVADIPTLNPATLALIALMLGGVGYGALRRRGAVRAE